MRIRIHGKPLTDSTSTRLSSLRLEHLLLASLLLVGPPACNGTAPEGEKTEGKPAEKQETAVPGDQKPETDVLRELERKLKPPKEDLQQGPAESQPKQVAPKQVAPTPPPPTVPPPERPVVTVAQEKLQREAEKFASTLAKALEDGDLERAKSHVISAAELKETVHPGHLATLEGMLLPANLRTVESLMKTVQGAGKKVEANLTPGKLSTTQQSVFRKEVPIMNGAVLELRVDGTPILLRLKQLIWTSEGWRAFQLSL